VGTIILGLYRSHPIERCRDFPPQALWVGFVHRPFNLFYHDMTILGARLARRVEQCGEVARLHPLAVL
jgi:hypothetical protein